MCRSNDVKLNELLPPVIDWIDATLANSANEARPVASFGFARLPRFYTPNYLNRVKVVVVDRVPAPPLAGHGIPEFDKFISGDYAAITLKDTYFIQTRHVGDESTHFHELVHTVQWSHLGAEQFLLAYATGLIKYGYRDSPLENQAYSLQKIFDAKGEPFDVEVEVRKSFNQN